MKKIKGDLLGVRILTGEWKIPVGFLLPAEFQVIVSAFLSILLGVLMAISKKSQKHMSQV